MFSTKLLSRILLPIALLFGAYGAILMQANGADSMWHAWYANSLLWLISAFVLGGITVLFTRLTR